MVFLTFALAVSYSQYKREKPLDINLDNLDGINLEGKDLTNSNDLMGIIEQAKQQVDFKGANPAIKVWREGILVAYIDHEGTVQGVGNVTFTDSEARGNGYGFFKYLGSSVSDITSGWFTDLWVSGSFNATNVTTAKVCDGTYCYTFSELNTTIGDTTLDPTNVAWINESNTFAENQIFSGNVSISGTNVSYAGCSEYWNGTCSIKTCPTTQFIQC